MFDVAGCKFQVVDELLTSNLELSPALGIESAACCYKIL